MPITDRPPRPRAKILDGITIHVAGSRAYASPPARPWIRDGAVVLDEATGKPKYQQVIRFFNHGTRASWCRQVLTAVRDQHPEVLCGTGAGDAP